MLDGHIYHVYLTKAQPAQAPTLPTKHPLLSPITARGHPLQPRFGQSEEANPHRALIGQMKNPSWRLGDGGVDMSAESSFDLG